MSKNPHTMESSYLRPTSTQNLYRIATVFLCAFGNAVAVAVAYLLSIPLSASLINAFAFTAKLCPISLTLVFFAHVYVAEDALYAIQRLGPGNKMGEA